MILEAPRDRTLLARAAPQWAATKRQDRVELVPVAAGRMEAEPAGTAAVGRARSVAWAGPKVPARNWGTAQERRPRRATRLVRRTPTVPARCPYAETGRIAVGNFAALATNPRPAPATPAVAAESAHPSRIRAHVRAA